MNDSTARAWISIALCQHGKAIGALVAIQIMCGLLVSLQPRYYQQLVSLVVDGAGGEMMNKGWSVAGLLVSLYVVIALLQGMGGYIGVSFSADLLRQLQVQFFEKTAQLPIAYFHNQSSGELFTKFNTDIGMAQKFMASVLPEVSRELVVAVSVICILLYNCPVVLTLVALVIVCVASLAILKLNQTMALYAREQRAGWSRINRTFDETVRGVDILKQFRAEKHMQNSFLNETATFRDLSVRAGTRVATFSPAIDLITRLGGLLPLFLAYYLISKGDMELDPFLLFFFYAALLNISITNLTGKLASIQTELTGIRNLALFFAETPEDREPEGMSGRITGSVSITLSGLTFAYPGGKPLYQNAAAFAPERAITVIHGESGSGKSTLINLLLKFYLPDGGSIRIGDTDLALISRAELRSTIGVVTQNHFIFQDTLRQNLLVAQPDASDDEIFAALNSAQLSDFVKNLPDGIDTMMGYQGKGCSGGEKQRICIARLLLRQSPVMILDEPWSNVDLLGRNALAEVINTCKNTATVLILTHEMPAVLQVDKVYQLDGVSRKFIDVSDHPAENQ